MKTPRSSRRIPFLLALLALGSSPSFSAELPELRVSYFSYPPFIIETDKSGSPRGAWVAYWEEVYAPAAKVKIKWVGPNSYPRARREATDGNVDAIAAVAVSLAEAEGLRYPKNFRVMTPRALVVLKSEPI